MNAIIITKKIDRESKKKFVFSESSLREDIVVVWDGPRGGVRFYSSPYILYAYRVPRSASAINSAYAASISSGVGSLVGSSSVGRSWW